MWNSRNRKECGWRSCHHAPGLAFTTFFLGSALTEHSEDPSACFSWVEVFLLWQLGETRWTGDGSAPADHQQCHRLNDKNENLAQCLALLNTRLFVYTGDEMCLSAETYSGFGSLAEAGECSKEKSIPGLHRQTLPWCSPPSVPHLDFLWKTQTYSSEPKNIWLVMLKILLYIWDYFRCGFKKMFTF